MARDGVTTKAACDGVLLRVEIGVGLLLTFLAGVLHVEVLRHAGPLWRDEVQSVNIARLPSLWATLENNLLDSFPVLWSLVLRSWTALGFGETDFGLRVLGLIVGLGIIAMLWWTARRLGCVVPLISLLLFALSPTVFRYGDALRAYGIGVLLALFMWGAIWSMVERPTPRRTALAGLVAVLAVHSLYTNSILLMAMCIGGGAVCLRKRTWKPVGLLAGIGLISAASMLPYLRTIASHRGWSHIVQQPIDLIRILGRFKDAAEPSGEFMVWLWPVLLVFTLAACCYLLLRSSSEAPEGDKDRSLFVVTTMITSVMAYLAYLKVIRLPTQDWYYIPMFAVMALSCEVALGPLIRPSRVGRFARLGFVVTLAGLTALNAWPMAQTRMSNLDRLAAELEASSTREDLIVVNPFYLGVTFNRYYSGDTPWMTLPDFEERRFQPYPLFKETMTEHEPIRQELERIAQTLQSGHRVWLVGGLRFLKPGEKPGSLPPAPDSPAGWSEGAYAAVWSRQAAYVVQANARKLSRVDVPVETRVNKLEDLPLVLAVGGP
jgi:hypothetical protein